MKAFTTITDLQILHEAYFSILDKYFREHERNEEFKREHGRSSAISDRWIEVYDKQLDELHEAILEIERQEAEAIRA